MLPFSSPVSRQEKTFALDSARGVSDGFVQSVLQTTAMLIAVQAFALADQLTALIASAPFVGNLLSLFYSAKFSTSRQSKSRLAAAPLFASSAAFLAAGWLGEGVEYALMVTLAIVLFQLRLTFLTSIYHENYPTGRRGVLFSRGLILMTLSSLAASWGYGKILEGELERFRWLMTLTACMALCSGVAVFNMPSSPPEASGASNPFKNLGLIRSQPVFGYILCAWFIFGFANLWVFPLRVVYVAEAERGLGLGPFQSLLLLGVALETGRLLSTPVWAKLFDRVNFIALRISMNGFLGVGLVVFFSSEDPMVIGTGSFLIGVCTGGGSLAWNLWVTKFAPRGETHIYMSVHSFLTGVRGVIGPQIAVLALGVLSMQQIGWISGALVLVSMLMLVFAFPMLKRHRAHATASD